MWHRQGMTKAANLLIIWPFLFPCCHYVHLSCKINCSCFTLASSGSGNGMEDYSFNHTVSNLSITATYASVKYLSSVVQGSYRTCSGVTFHAGSNRRNRNGLEQKASIARFVSPTLFGSRYRHFIGDGHSSNISFWSENCAPICENYLTSTRAIPATQCIL